jgi:hypothetical protein
MYVNLDAHSSLFEEAHVVIQDLGMKRNIRAVLGDNVLMWCCPTRPPGTGLRYDLKNSDGEHFHLPLYREDDHYA